MPADAVVTLADRFSPFVYDGVWAMSANGAARLMFEYPEPTRSEILDLLFVPGKGTRWQGLKVESPSLPSPSTPNPVRRTPAVCMCMCLAVPSLLAHDSDGACAASRLRAVGGDVESSYGSMSSYAHVADKTWVHTGSLI